MLQRGSIRLVRRAAGWLGGGTIALTMGVTPCIAQVPLTLNGPPVQVQPYVSEPGVPPVVINQGSQNPFGGLGGNSGMGGSSGGGNSGNSDALATMLQTSWGAVAAADAQSLGLNASALAATCVIESQCGSNTGDGGGAQGVFQMYPAAFQEGLKAALATNPALASQIVQGAAGMNDPVTEAIAASGYLMQANSALQNAGITNPSVINARGYYNFGPSNGIQLAQASTTETMAQAMPNVSQSTLQANGIYPGETIGQWQASIASKIGSAADQSVMG